MPRNLALPLGWIAGCLLLVALAAYLRPPGSHGALGSRDNVLRLAMRSDVESLDSAIAYEVETWPLVRLVNQGLLDYGEGTDLVPWLAKALPTISRDGRTLTFELREGIRFSNGRELIASDFVYTIERLLDPATKSPGDGFFRGIVGARDFQEARSRDSETARSHPGAPRARVTPPLHVRGLRAPGRYTFQIELAAPDLSFLHVMAMPFTYVVAREEVEKWGDLYYQHPLGTGPYLLQEWRRSTRIVYVKNPRYSLRQPEIGRLDGVEIQIGADDLLQQMMFERNELDYTLGIPDSDFIRLTHDPFWKQHIVTMPTCATRYLAMNCEMEPFTDRRVRQAVCHAVDKSRMMKIIKGQGVSAKSVLPPNMPGYSPGIPDYEFNPARSRALLAEAGKSGGLTVPLWVSVDDSRNMKIAQSVQQDLAAVGIKIEIRSVAATIFGEATGRRKNAPFGLHAWYQDYPDPSNFLDVLLNGKRIVDEQCNNKSFYSNPAVNELLARAAVDIDRERRLDLYRQAERLIMADAPWVCLYHPQVYLLRQPWLKGIKLHPVWPARYERFWIDRS